ncbi:uncharacterized protein TRAVEDRAFT_56256 [Trametes versicolor FP-101664 SS1]|uniref:uncharacterized protein n=1 Tax=Trametes versicolor (strain FP-101664) TaxID=717944 RepID=UPI00046242DC|nr:uncharacterized protein TRAVEDRAFT_56256 [Trametes versicolor FP-101664 SS1]EIW63110.1 hypothetical protein TRAVEDRAFT_56256 [Trametes versicolor FP-101664 SS1]
MPAQLPPELIDRILDHLHRDRRALAACALASHVMLPTSRYHRFRDLTLHLRQVSTLMSLIDSAPNLALAINSVCVRFKDWADPKQELEFLTRLPALSSFGMVTPAYQRVSVEHLAVVASHIPALTSLFLCGPGVITAPLLLSGLSLFRALREVRLHSIDVHFPPEPDVPYDLTPLPPLRRLESRASDGAPLISRWLQVHSATPGLLSLQHTIQDPRDAIQFDATAIFCAGTVKNLEIVFAPEGRMTDALRGSEFWLESFSVLETCTLRFAFGEMCVAQNESLLSIPTILSQLSSPFLRTITIALVVDNVEDLRSLNSECAVRNLSPAYFEDMRVLDWTTIEQLLTGENLGSIQALVLEGQGQCHLLESYLRDCCPTLHSRRLVSPVTVDKEDQDRWW